MVNARKKNVDTLYRLSVYGLPVCVRLGCGAGLTICSAGHEKSQVMSQ